MVVESSNALQRSLAHAIHARTLRQEQAMALLPPPVVQYYIVYGIYVRYSLITIVVVMGSYYV